MPYAGLDVHKRVIEAAIIDEYGRLLHRDRLPCSRETLRHFAAEHLGPEVRVALEATTNTWALVELLEPFAQEVVVSNPLRTRAIAEAKIKTDRVDALVLAQLLRCDYLPRVWQPDPHTRQQRRRTSRRASLVGDRTRVKNRIHAVLHQRLMGAPRDLFGKTGRQWLGRLELDPEGRAAIDSELRLLETIEAETASLDQVLARDAFEDPAVKLLMTLPGVDVTIAQTLRSTLGNAARFRDGDHAASYLGLVPSTRQSAHHCYHGPITKQGRSHARWLMVQAAQHLDRHPGPLGVFFRRLAHKKNRNVAVVATARKLVVIAWHMLRHQEPYRYAQPRTVHDKFARLRKANGQPRRRGGLPKGSPRPAAYGSGKRTRAIPSLDRVYQQEQLPALPPRTAGEQHNIKRSNTTAFVEEIHQTRRVPRRCSKSNTINT